MCIVFSADFLFLYGDFFVFVGIVGYAIYGLYLCIKADFALVFPDSGFVRSRQAFYSV